MKQEFCKSFEISTKDMGLSEIRELTNTYDVFYEAERLIEKRPTTDVTVKFIIKIEAE